MTGHEIVQTALLLMGYTDSDGEVSSAVSRGATGRALAAVRQIYAELGFALGKEVLPLASLAEEIPLPSRILTEVMPYGVATLLAIGEGDNNAEAAFSLIYNRKRSLLTGSDRREDRIPHPEENE